jgi:hypothetical protein
LALASCGDGEPSGGAGGTNNGANNGGANNGGVDGGLNNGGSDGGDSDVAGPDAGGDSGGDAGDDGGDDGGTDADPPECQELGDYFEAAVWTPLMRDQCVGCHNEGGIASGTRLLLVREEDSPDWRAVNLATLQVLALEEVDSIPLLLARPSGMHPDGHTGGLLVTPGTLHFEGLARLVARLRGELDECGQGELPRWGGECGAESRRGARLLRRLTHDEYAATLSDLLGVTIDPARFPPDDAGLRSVRADRAVAGLLADKYREVAEDAAALANLVQLVPCSLSEGTSACAATFIEDFGLRAFRRPLSHEEIQRYLDFYAEIAVEDGFVGAIRWTIVALLQSPQYLYRAELGRRGGDGIFALTSYEIATELSYGIWGTMPDDELFELARTGTLYDAEVVGEQAERMLVDLRARSRARRFVGLWLGLDRFDTVVRDPDVYPALTPSIREAMKGETDRFVGSLWDSGGTLEDFLTVPTTFLNGELAGFYGLDQPAETDGEGFGPVSLEGTEYGGVLTQGSLLTTHALPTNSSPIHRGVMVREEFLCQPLPPPPANLDTSPPEVDPNLSTRERYLAHSADPACSGCHSLIDSLGFGFEHFDGIGRYREQDGIHVVDASGEIVRSNSTDGQFDGVAGLAALLAGSDEVHACYVDKWAEFTWGLDPVDAEVACLVEPAQEEFNSGGRRMTDAVVALLVSEHSRGRIGEEGELDGPGAALPEPGGGPYVADPFDPGDEPDLPDPEEGQEVTISTTLDEWQSGYTLQVVVTSVVDYEVEWGIEMEVRGTIVNLWNAEASGDSGDVTFSGVDWNRVLPPGGSAEFGFVGNLE